MIKLFKLENELTGQCELKEANDISEISLIGWTKITFLRNLSA